MAQFAPLEASMKSASPATSPNMSDSLRGFVRPIAKHMAPCAQPQKTNQNFLASTLLVRL